MHTGNFRARAAVGAAVLAIAGSAALGQFSASASTTPDTEPESSEPAAESVPESSAPEASAPELDEQREALVDGVVEASDGQDLPLDWDCVAGLVAQLPDADVTIISEQITAQLQDAEAADDTAVAEDSAAADDAVATTVSATETGVADSQPTAPALSPEADALGQQLVYCASGDADPELVTQVVTLLETSEVAPEFDLECAAAILTTFEDETLELMIASGVEQVTELSAMPVGVPDATDVTDATEAAAASAPETSVAAPETVPEEAIEDATRLLACSSAVTGSSVDSSAATEPAGSEPAGTESVTETTEA